MLRQVAEGVLIHESEFCRSNAVVVSATGPARSRQAPRHVIGLSRVALEKEGFGPLQRRKVGCGEE